MPISDVTVDWDQQIINVPKTATQLVQSNPTEIRDLDLNLFRLQLKNLEDDADGMAFVDTHSHNTIVTVGGVTLAHVLIIINGYTVTFEDGQYAVNLVGANSNVGDVTNVNQVSIRAANSAGLVHIEEILDQSFDGHVTINTITGLSGQQYPRGIPTDPVDNYPDALAIATSRSFNDYSIRGSLILTGSDDISDTQWTGDSALTALVTLGGGNTESTSFKDVALTGTSNGYLIVRSCLLLDISAFSGFVEDSVIRGNTTITLASHLTLATAFVDCLSGSPVGIFPIIDLTNFTSSDTLIIRNFSGTLKLTNLTVTAEVSIDMVAGHIEIDSTCTAGTITIRGLSDLTDNSAGSTVNTDALINVPELNARVLQIRANTSATLGLI